MEYSNLIQVFAYAAMMASSIFIPLMADGFGASPAVVGLLVGAYNLAFLLSSYLFGLLSDKYGGKHILKIGLLSAALFFFLQIFAQDLFSLFVVRSLAGACAGIFPAALAVYAYKEQHGKMGKFTGSGSLGWSVGAMGAGVIFNNQIIFMASAFFFLVAFFLSLRLAKIEHVPRKISVFPRRFFLRNARIYIPYFFRALGAQAAWAIFPLYLVFTGADKLWVGIAYFVNTFSQYFIMRYVEKFHNLYLVNVGLLLSIVTFIGYALFPYLSVVLLLQLLLAFSFSTLLVGTVQELLEVNLEQSTAIGLLNSITNFTAVISPFMAGFVAQAYGYGGVMWMAAFFTFIGLISFTTVLE
jgi:MFS family permease